MDFRVTEDQQSLRAGVRSFCEQRVTLERLRELEAEGGFDRSLWKELAGLGVFGVRRPEARGGLGLGMAEATLVFEEIGRSLVPGPILWTHLAADLVEGAAGGQVVVGGLDVTTAPSGPCVVEHFDALDVLLVLRSDRLERLDPRTLDGKSAGTPLDPLTPVHRLEHLPHGELVGGREAAAEIRRTGATLAAAGLLGIAEAALDLALEHAKRREQFGRVIGSFQALKHMLADMFSRQELARAGVYAAAATLDHPEVGEVERAVSSAKLVAAEAAMKNCRSCIQIHGGMGYTWEVPAHYYFKRAWVLESSFGTVRDHAARLAEGITATSS